MGVPVFDSPFIDGKMKVRQSIILAANELMAQAPFGKVTVSAICKQAHVSRQTFYECFKDKNDLAIWLEAGIVVSCLEKVGVTFSWEQAIEILFRNLISNASFLVAGIVLSSERAAFHRGCAQIVSDALIRELEWNRKVPMTADLRLQCRSFPVVLISLADLLLIPKDRLCSETEIARLAQEAKASLPSVVHQVLAYVPKELGHAMAESSHIV